MSDPIEDLLRLQVMQLKREASTQAALILEMNAAGFSSARIADLLGTSSNAVTGVISKAKARAAKSG